MLIQLVSGLPPMINGVGDYALGVARVLRDAHDIGSAFIVCSPQWAGPAEIEGFPAFTLRQRSASALVSVLQKVQGATARYTTHASAPTLLLQLSPYGFNTHGAPFWLSQALHDWKGAGSERRIITMFHELYAIGLPWTRAFWASAFQRAAVRRIVMISDVAMTNMERYAAILHRWDPSKVGMISILPVASNIGEVAEIIPLAARTRRLVLFGSGTARATTFREHSSEIHSLCSALELQEITEIGVNGDCRESEFCGVKRQYLGVLSARAISQILQDSVVGLVNYPVAFLGKSGIFAAYCAHGVLPIRLGQFPDYERSLDGLEAGRHFASTKEIYSGLTWSDAERIAVSGWSWYGEHCIRRHADVIRKHLLPGSVVTPQR